MNSAYDGEAASPSPIMPVCLSIIARIVEGCDAHVRAVKWKNLCIK